MSAARARALEALYEATDGANWTQNEGWQIGTDPCDPSTPPFAGITCNGNQIVAVLLILFGLQGHLPTELGLLTNVEYFDFSSNMMSGTVPTQVGNLRAYSFDARNAVFLSGTIPLARRLYHSLTFLLSLNNLLTSVLQLMHAICTIL